MASSLWHLGRAGTYRKQGLAEGSYVPGVSLFASLSLSPLLPHLSVIPSLHPILTLLSHHKVDTFVPLGCASSPQRLSPRARRKLFSLSGGCLGYACHGDRKLMSCFTLCLPLLDHTQRRATQRQEEVNLEHLSSEGVHAGIPSVMDSSIQRGPTVGIQTRLSPGHSNCRSLPSSSVSGLWQGPWRALTLQLTDS